MDIGQYNNIPEGAIQPWPHGTPGPVVIGDCNTIHEGVRILVGPGGFRMGDYNTIHNGCFLGGPGSLRIGYNCWIGQRSVLDSTGGLLLGNGVTVGYQCHVWSHVARGEQIEGWRAESKFTILGSDVWLVGDTVTVNPGVRMAPRSSALAHSVIVHDTKPNTVYGGVPARRLPDISLCRTITIDEQVDLLWRWAQKFCRTNSYYYAHGGERKLGTIILTDGPSRSREQVLLFSREGPPRMPEWSCFNLWTKLYTKQLTQLEREFMRFLRGKAHFVPCDLTV